MVTLYDLGVEITIQSGYSYNFPNTSTVVKNFAESFDEMNHTDLDRIAFREYEEVKILFHSQNVDDRIYFDGIDLLSEEYCNIDKEGNLYLSPSKMAQKMFEFSSSKYAIRVGTFAMRLVHDGRNYYQWFQILPKNVNQQEWQIMRQELEEEIQGLSADVIKKSISIGASGTASSSNQELYHFFVMRKYINQILAAFLDLKEKPNYKIEKIYQREPMHRISKMDGITFRDYLKKGEGKQSYLVPKRSCNYDLPENRWLKKIITFYENELHTFETSTKRYIELLRIELKELVKFRDKNQISIELKKKTLSELEKYLESAKTISNLSRMIKEEEWYGQIKKDAPVFIPHVLIYDVRYNAFYKMCQELRQESVKIQWSEGYAYSQKRSETLYEIWCFVKVCRFLISEGIGFEPQGWIFDEFSEGRVLIPELLSGTVVGFVKGEFRIKLHYDEPLCRQLEDTTKENQPVFTKGRHYRPDIRMDLYREDVYWSTIIFEVKYRKIQSIFQDKTKKQNRDTKSFCENQIRGYKNELHSKYCRGLDENFALRKLNPVDRVWVLNPTHHEGNIIDKEEEGIKLIQLIPGKNHQEIILELKEEISEAFDGELI